MEPRNVWVFFFLFKNKTNSIFSNLKLSKDQNVIIKTNIKNIFIK